MKHFNRFLKFFNLVDSAGDLSITNILVIAFSIKLMICHNVDFANASIMLLPLLNYAHKRYQNAKSGKQVNEVQEEISAIQQSIVNTNTTVQNIDINVNNLAKRIDQVNSDLNQQKTESTKMALHVGLR